MNNQTSYKNSIKKKQGIKKHGKDHLCNFALVQFHLQLRNSLNISAHFWLCPCPQHLHSDSEETLTGSYHSLHLWQQRCEWVNVTTFFLSLCGHHNTECVIAQTQRSWGAEPGAHWGQQSHPCVNVNGGGWWQPMAPFLERVVAPVDICIRHMVDAAWPCKAEPLTSKTIWLPLDRFMHCVSDILYC